MDALYLKDSYLKSWKTKVIEVNDRKFIVLDKTAFYPKGGGQPHDEGYIIKGDQEYFVDYVGKFKGNISHEVDKEGLEVGDIVSCSLDWERRYTFMRYHTAAHLISAIVYNRYGAMITGNQIGLDRTRIDFSMENYSPEKLDDVISQVNEIIEKDLEVETYMITREEAMKHESLTKLAMGLPDKVKNIRIVKIGDIDEQADAGTHVKKLSEIGRVKLEKTANKGKNNRRIYFSLY
ncbi:MAG: alanyl-tRNA editing protein [Promethearchaeota archaeon]|nr:MAG: alanyl-tRNA editing protein [Candidatus Lokiarchaeota archaeon]